METFPPLLWATFRSWCTAGLLLIAAVALKRPHPRFDREFIRPLLFFGFLNFVTQVFFLEGLHNSTTSNSAILNAVTPLTTLVIAIRSGREKLTSGRVYGFVASIVGIMILCRIEDFNFSNQTFFGDCQTLVYCVSYGSFLGLSQSFLSKYDRVWITGWMFVVAAIGLSIVTAPQWSDFHWPIMTRNLWFTTFYGIIFAGVIGYYMMLWVVAHAPASQVALFDYLQPVLVTFFAWYYFTEKITSRTWLGGGLIVLGVTMSMEWDEQKIRRIYHRIVGIAVAAERMTFRRLRLIKLDSRLKQFKPKLKLKANRA